MASIWKGALSFGLVNVVVKVHAATENNDVSFHQVHAEDGGRIRYKRVCEKCGEVVEFTHIAKAYESDSGQTVMLNEDDLATLPAGRSREIDVLEFVPAQDVDPIMFDRSYYLEPEATALRPYALLREALKRTDRMAIAKVALRNKTRLAALRVSGNVIVLQTLLWPDEVRAPAFAILDEEAPEPRKNELQMAEMLIATMESEFEPDEYSDEYREQVLALIERKLTAGEDIITPVGADGEPAPDSTNVVDLMSALQASIDRRAAKKAEAAEHGGPPQEGADAEAEEESKGKPKATRKTAKRA